MVLIIRPRNPRNNTVIRWTEASLRTLTNYYQIETEEPLRVQSKWESPFFDSVAVTKISGALSISTASLVFVRLLYERVPRRKSAEMMLLHLDDPVTEFLPLRGGSRRHELTELPMGIISPGFITLWHCVQANTSCAGRPWRGAESTRPAALRPGWRDSNLTVSSWEYDLIIKSVTRVYQPYVFLFQLCRLGSRWLSWCQLCSSCLWYFMPYSTKCVKRTDQMQNLWIWNKSRFVYFIQCYLRIHPPTLNSDT